MFDSRWTWKNQKWFYASFLTWHRTGKGAPGLNFFLNLPDFPGSQLKINVYVQQFTYKEKKRNSQSPSVYFVGDYFGPSSFAENSFIVSIIFIWEISQELSEPYQSAVTKVITCKDTVGAFFMFFDRLCRSVDCTERGGKQVTIMNERNVKLIVLSRWLIFFSIIIKCNINLTSSLGKISCTWALYGG